MSTERVVKPGLEEMIRTSPSGETFLVPAPICDPVFQLCHDDGAALRVLFALVWLSSDTMRTGVRARFQASLAEIRIAAGFEGYAKDVPVLRALEQLGSERCILPEIGEIDVFSDISVVDPDERVLEWVFDERFQEMFVSPRIFAIVSISEIVNLKSGLDFYLYLQVRRIWKMQKKAATLPIESLMLASGFGEIKTFQRLSERVRRTIVRLERLLDSNLAVRPIKRPGARRYSEMRLEVRSEA